MGKSTTLTRRGWLGLLGLIPGLAAKPVSREQRCFPCCGKVFDGRGGCDCSDDQFAAWVQKEMDEADERWRKMTEDEKQQKLMEDGEKWVVLVNEKRTRLRDLRGNRS